MRRSILLACALLLGSCSRKAEPSHEAPRADAPRGVAVARVGKIELSQADVERAQARDPGASPARFDGPDARRELVDGLVRFELLAQAAERAGLMKDPDAIHAMRQIAVTKLVNQTLGAAASPESITPQDIEREYAARQASEFTRPEAVQLRHILVSDSKLAERLAARARALAPSDDDGFAELASQHSEDLPTRARGGDLGFVERTSRVPAPLRDAGLTLKAPGDVAGPIRTEAGYELVRLVSRRAAAVSPLSSVAEPIRQRLYRERRAQALDALIERLRRETPVELLEQRPNR